VSQSLAKRRRLKISVKISVKMLVKFTRSILLLPAKLSNPRLLFDYDSATDFPRLKLGGFPASPTSLREAN
jgi:hypothetical protein